MLPGEGEPPTEGSTEVLPGEGEPLTEGLPEVLTGEGNPPVKATNELPPGRKLILLGDSMIRRTDTAMNMGGQSGRMRVCLPGANMVDIMENAKTLRLEKEAVSCLIIQGGGNGLEWIGAKGTVEVIMKGIEEIEKQQRHIRVIVCGIIRRPAETGRYEQVRKETNMLLREAVGRKEGQLGGLLGIRFADLEGIREEHFRRDQVHLNEEGVEALVTQLWRTVRKPEGFEANSEGRRGRGQRGRGQRGRGQRGGGQ